MGTLGEIRRSGISRISVVIFVTVGAQMPFDRLINAVDSWAADHDGTEVFAQIGKAGARPKHVRWKTFIDPEEFKLVMQEANVIVAHAGTGSIITALEYGKPILVMPRRADLHETRNDHQIATAERFREMGSVAVALDENELYERLDELESIEPGRAISASASPELISAIRDFVHSI